MLFSILNPLKYSLVIIYFTINLNSDNKSGILIRGQEDKRNERQAFILKTASFSPSSIVL